MARNSNITVSSDTGKAITKENNTQPTCANSMRLFGLPYQFIDSVDPRIKSVSNIVGTNFVEKIIADAPTVMIIPGKAKFLPNSKDKEGTSHALLEAVSDNVGALFTKLSEEKNEVLRYYDFEEDYNNYMKYVNLLCRTVAVFLGLTYRMSDGSGSTSLQEYDWRNYRWNAEKYTSAVGASISTTWSSMLNTIVNAGKAFISGFKGDGVGALKMDDLSLDENHIGKIARTNNFVQFYVDPGSGASQSMGNTTSQSQIKTAMDTASSTVKEFQFVANSAGAGGFTSGMESMTESGLDALTSSLGGGDGAFGTVMNQILSAGKSVVKGENIILPEVYQGSDYGIDYTIDIHLRAPYGNKYSIYVDVIVPLLHLLALCLPKQGSANTFASPFLVKAYFPGVFNCNLGIIESMQISRPSSEDAYSIDGLPTEIDVQLRIKDLYSDLSISPSNSPALFRNNTSLIDYLATLSGLDLIAPQHDTKMMMLVNSWASAIADIDDNAQSLLFDAIERTFAGFISL